MQKIPRNYSERFEQGKSDVDLLNNRNVEWMNYRFFRLSYIIFILVVWAVLHMSQVFSPAEEWTVVNVVHGVTTFVLLHWIKGCPDETTQGEYNALTVYEQVDAGTPWTTTKKFLMLVPTLLVWISCHAADYRPIYVVVNSGVFLILIIAKIPEMHRVRLFGINSTPGIDTKIEYSPNKSD
mmetsp:Transcript_1860/g.2946  ORF Transcript_1860/g.2946 Transcript_1860/m.2946 type:complete len:181 (-) Transcript_1860:174-716(-)|eukprot:CAMPEP_0185025324 /NCGR_PEP_ID=MMETSP1103-20130426/8329_1 /TAXON_ID=36769 /ORGANISM="Paraphysomonas bandaiensis, Strain Caron Lab Isolate" /LENGTH=180 /DNA_ID=CAMNT_0027558505 /DNA_START=165 /DNA_END=707 /DNA_ORIENTATION=+